MLISPPFLRTKNETETDEEWIERMMPVDPQRGYPLNAHRSWHGGVHIRHSDSGSRPELLRTIADGSVVSFRHSDITKRQHPPLNYNGKTDNGYVLVRHVAETGSQPEDKITWYSLYMHIKDLDPSITVGQVVKRKSPLGTVGMVDDKNAVHFQIFCDDENIARITGRNTAELDLSQHGRTTACYGDMHFYIPAGTPVYSEIPTRSSEEPSQTTQVDLFVSMTLGGGRCTMTTRRKNVIDSLKYDEVGEALVDADGEEYEYNLYKKALKLYPASPSAGFELLRFGRVINTRYETLTPADAPLWRTITTPQGKGLVNLAVESIKKYSDADFPHWTGWRLVDDDEDTNSQCNSPTILGSGRMDLSRTVCHFPLEWDIDTVESRYGWLKQPSPVLDEPMSQQDWGSLAALARALALENSAQIPTGRVWHFDPRRFIAHFRKCGWLERAVSEKVMTSTTSARDSDKINRINKKVVEYSFSLNVIMRKYNLVGFNRISHFLGQGAVESGYLLSMQESSQEQYTKNGRHFGGNIVDDSEKNESNELGHWYGSVVSEVDVYFSGAKYNRSGGLIASSYSWRNGNCGDVDAQKFRGRGFKMLTGLDTYSSYWVYRGWLSKSSFDASWWTDPQYRRKNLPGMIKRPPQIDDPHKVTETPYNCIDTGAFYIVCFKNKTLKMMDSDRVTSRDDNEVVERVTRSINGGAIGIEDRKKTTKAAKEILSDEV
ncbi:M23 family peptidase [Erwinia aphidicola]|uniref:M23 family peptidase n=1 Tax=Erwinia aphidicola TaxID=68334 RepID=UPI00300D19E0